MNKSIFDEVRSNPNFSLGKSIAWYRKQIKGLGVSQSSLLNDPARKVTKLTPGYLYLFSYDPKGKDKLPFYDTFPLSFVFNIDSVGFHGINFHYLPYDVRFKLFDAMMLTSTNKTIDDKTRLRLNWQQLSNASKFPAVRPAVKRYLFSHVGSRFIQIPITDWKTALLLPVESFVGSSKQKVWQNSKAMM